MTRLVPRDKGHLRAEEATGTYTHTYAYTKGGYTSPPLTKSKIDSAGRGRGQGGRVERDRRMENWYEGKRSVRAGEAISIFLKANSPGSARIILGKDRFPLVPLISSATFRHD